MFSFSLIKLKFPFMVVAPLSSPLPSLPSSLPCPSPHLSPLFSLPSHFPLFPPLSPHFLECEGLDTSETIDDATIDRFSGCNIVTTGGIHIGIIAESNFK